MFYHHVGIRLSQILASLFQHWLLLRELQKWRSNLNTASLWKIPLFFELGVLMMVRMLVTRLGMYSCTNTVVLWRSRWNRKWQRHLTRVQFRSTRVADSPSPPTQPTAAAGVMTKSAPKASDLLVRTCAASRFLVNTMEETYELSVIRKIY